MTGGLLFIIYMIMIFLVDGLGAGDMYLIGVIGLFFSFNNFIRLLVLPYMISSIFAVYLLVIKKKDKKYELPFGPFIIISAICFI